MLLQTVENVINTDCSNFSICLYSSLRPYVWCDVPPNAEMPICFANSQEDDCEDMQVDPPLLDTLVDKAERSYFECDKPSELTIHDIIEVTLGCYLSKILHERAEKDCVYCCYLSELYRRQYHSCIDTLPLYYIEGHQEEIKKEIFNENYVTAQIDVLCRLGIISFSPHNIQDIAAVVL